MNNNKAWILALVSLSSTALAKNFDQLAKTPPMGWNSWNRFACDVSEASVLRQADAMVASGLKTAGYQYIIIDDCWQGDRDKDGFVQADPKRFPTGIKRVADHVHSLGLQFGIYSDAGSKTCGGRPGSRGHEYQDALTYARWGVDYLKYDWCNTDGLNAAGAYATMSDALVSAGRPVVFSICEWGNNQPWKWAAPYGHLWRTTGDITSCFDCVVDHGGWKSWGVLQILDKQEGLRAYAGPGHFNDPDMLEVGNGMSLAEDRAHFSLWAMLAAPLIAGNDLSTMSKATTAILGNREVIRIDQDPLGAQGFRYLAIGDLEVWAKPLADGDLALAFLSRARGGLQVHFDWAEHPIKDDLGKYEADFKKKNYAIRDLWAGKEVGSTDRALNGILPSHDVWMLRLHAASGTP
jgi:alpha-galactosidase